MEDKEIIKLCNNRIETAITELMNKYGKLCNHLARNILHSAQDEDECVNDSYLAFWNNVPPHIPNSVKSYLLKLLRNICINRFYREKAQKRNTTFDVAMDELGEIVCTKYSPEEVVIANDLTNQINIFLESLDETSQGLFVYRYWYGYSIEEIAEKFGLKYNTTAVKLNRIRTKLKEYLQEREINV